MKYRKKPVVIEAFQLGEEVLPAWFRDEVNWPNSWHDAITNRNITLKQDQGDCRAVSAHIQTLEGVMVASPGDFIIQGVQGEIYPCKPDIFEATYEQVEE